MLNLDQCIEQLYRGEILGESMVREICERLKELMLYESNVHMIKAPVTVVGDVHGYHSSSTVEYHYYWNLIFHFQSI